MSVHKNFIEGYGRNWGKLCKEKLLPYQGEIFRLFADKFYTDAEKDGERGRNLLKSRGSKCGELCNEIHQTLGGNDIVNEYLEDLVNNVVNLDYGSLSEIFGTLEAEYLSRGEEGISSQISIICTYLKKMLKISEFHTTIKKE